MFDTSRRRLLAAGTALLLCSTGASAGTAAVELPNGQFISPTFATGSVFQTLDPHLTGYKNYRAGWAVRIPLSARTARRCWC
jgi:hypothetical protein